MDIKELKRKRDNLRATIKENMDKLEHKPQLLNKIKQKVILYNELTNQLQEAGYKVGIQMDYLTLEYWNSDLKNIQHKTEPKKIKEISTESPTSNVPDWEKIADELEHRLKSKNNYIITLAWSETETQKPSTGAIENIKRYFNSMNMNEIDTDFSDMGNRKEYMIKYEYVGEDNSFKIIKNSAQFMLDTLSVTDYDKFNIAIFGKKVE